jgi:hypothetical protein
MRKDEREVRKERWMRKERCEGERREEGMRENPRTNKKWSRDKRGVGWEKG